MFTLILKSENKQHGTFFVNHQSVYFNNPNSFKKDFEALKIMAIEAEENDPLIFILNKLEENGWVINDADILELNL